MPAYIKLHGGADEESLVNENKTFEVSEGLVNTHPPPIALGLFW